MKVNKTKVLADITTECAVVHFISTHVREMADAQKVVDEIEDIAYNYNLKRVVVNFSRLQQMTSSLLSKLITLNNTLRQIDVKLFVCGMNKDMERAFKICKLQKIIPLFDTEEEAISA